MTLEINIVAYIIIMVVWLIYAISGDDREGFIYSEKDWRVIIFIVGGIAFSLIWGGIFWW